MGPTSLGAAAALERSDENTRSITMVTGIHGWFERQHAPIPLREQRANQFSDHSELRDRIRDMLGIMPAEQAQSPAITVSVDVARAATATAAQLSQDGCQISVTAVQWPAFSVGGVTVHGEGLWLRPVSLPVTARLIVIPDADDTPELACKRDGYALRLAAEGKEVLVVHLIDRDNTFSGSSAAQTTASSFQAAKTNQPHREWLHRPAFEMGRTLIGYEVCKALAAVDALSEGASLPVGIYGYGEGGLLALFVAALDTRVAATVISGYWEGRRALHEEPLYRNLFGCALLVDDAELSWLIAPRALIIEHATVDTVEAAPEATPGRICTPLFTAVVAECARANAGLEQQGYSDCRVQLVAGDGDNGGENTVEHPACTRTRQLLEAALLAARSPGFQPLSTAPALLDPHTPESLSSPTMPLPASIAAAAAGKRMQRQIRELEACTAAAVQQGEAQRNMLTWQRLGGVSTAAE